MLQLCIYLSWGYVLVYGHQLLPISDRRIVDLGYPFDSKTIVWPGGQRFEIYKQEARYKSPSNYWYAANDFRTAEHCGTHLDAPYHFSKTGWKVDDIPLERLVAVGAILNVSSETNGNPDYKLPVSKLIEWEEKNGPFPNNSVIFVCFGWASRYGDRDAYLGPNGTLSFPGLSKEAAEWIAGTQRVVGVGLDTASVDQGRNVIAHITLQKHNIYLLENVALNYPLPSVFNVVVMPMKLANGTGAPSRIIALL